jgi:dienelactone hydrolase
MKKIIFLSLLIIVSILFTTQIKRGFLTLLILVDSVRPPEKAFMGKLYDGPLVKKVTVPSKGRSLSADLYSPKGKGKYVPLLLVHGGDPAGKDDARLVVFAKALARAGFLVLVPDLEGMKTLRIRLSDAEDILQSFLYLNGHEQAAQRGGAMAGFSYGSGPMLLAAADARIREKVRIVATFNGYYDLRNIMLFGLTGVFEYGGHRGLMRPDTALRWMLAYRNADLLRAPNDQLVLKKAIEKRNRYELAGADALAKTLGKDGKALYMFLLNSDPEQFPPLYENLPLRIREAAYQLSPARAIKFIPAYFIIAHATDDYSSPYTESSRLADAVGDPGRAHLALLPQFLQGETLEPSARAWFNRYGVGGWRIFFALYDLLEKGDSMRG